MDRSAIDRGKALVRQVLTFARKTESSFRPLSLNTVVDDCVKMLGTTFPKTIRLRILPGAGLPNVHADENQLSQVIMNLTVNARDAMPDGGEITISTGTVDGASLVERHPDATAAGYVRLSVSDDGAGMDRDTLKRIFEPFFTTKGRGKGTGLGLSVVYGIVGSHQGFIETRSEPGKGTTVDIFFPATGETETAPAPSVPGSGNGRPVNGTVLIIEDEEMILESVSELLEDAGYACIRAKDGREGLDAWKANRERIQLVMLDIDLPKMGGWDVLRKMRDIDEEVRVVLCSGYFDPGTKGTRDGRELDEYLPKPYSGKEVLESIARVMKSRSAVA